MPLTSFERALISVRLITANTGVLGLGIMYRNHRKMLTCRSSDGVGVRYNSSNVVLTYSSGDGIFNG